MTIVNKKMTNYWTPYDKYYNKVGTGHRASGDEKGFISTALDHLSDYTGNCINFEEYTACDSWMDIDCSPTGNYVEMTCAYEGKFNEGCWGSLGMNEGANSINLESASCTSNKDHCFSHFNGMGMVHQQFLHILGMVGEHQRPDASFYINLQEENLDLSPELSDDRFSPIDPENWQFTGPFDFNSVTMNSFYDFNIRSLDELTAAWDETQYSIVRKEW